MGAILFGEPIVVSAHHRLIDLIVANAAPESGTDVAGKQHFGVDTILVLLAQTLLGRAGAGRVFIIFTRKGIERTPFFIGQAAGNVGDQTLQWLAFLQHRQRAVFEGDHLGRAVAEPCRHTLGVTVGTDLQMGVGGNALILHKSSDQISQRPDYTGAPGVVNVRRQDGDRKFVISSAAKNLCGSLRPRQNQTEPTSGKSLPATRLELPCESRVCNFTSYARERICPCRPPC